MKLKIPKAESSSLFLDSLQFGPISHLSWGSKHKIGEGLIAFSFAALLLSAVLAAIPPVSALDVGTSTIHAPEVWATGNRGQGVTVAVIDTGFDVNHDDLGSAIRYTYDVVAQDTYVGPDPGHGDVVAHGTHIAGIIAGRGTRSSGVYKGVAPEAQLVLVKVPYLHGENLTDAVHWVISNRYTYDIRVLSLSSPPSGVALGGDGLESSYSEALDYAVENGIVVVHAAGDYGLQGSQTIVTGGNAFNVITVGAIDDKNTPEIDNDEFAYYHSGYTYKNRSWSPWGSGKGTTGDGRPKPDVVAPGVHIWSLRSPFASSDMYEDVEGTIYGELSGTSCATPYVAGTVALMLHANPNLTPAQVKAILRETADLNTNLSGLTVNERGHGIINAYEAVWLAQYPDMIDSTQMYDSWNVETPHRDIAPSGNHDYLRFKVASPSSAFGIGLSDIHYHSEAGPSYPLLKTLSATHVWLFDTYYNLGTDMNQYLFNGPRIWGKGLGYVLMWARYRVNGWFIEFEWKLDVDEIYLHLGFGMAQRWTTLIYIDPNIWDSLNYAYLPSTSENVTCERTVLGDVPLDIRYPDPNLTDYIQIDPLETDNPTMYVLKYGYFGYNPASVQNYEYIYNRNIVVYYRAGTPILNPDPGPTIHRKTNPIIDPNPTQDDAHTGGDAGNDFNSATAINFPAGYPGILCYSDPEDTNDWYRFYAPSGKTIIANMTPPYGIDFNIELYDPNGNLRDGSYLGPGCTDSVSIITDVAGYWRIRIYIVSGEALYYFNIINPHGGGGGGNPPSQPDSINPDT
jgi:serine protease AprX